LGNGKVVDVGDCGGRRVEIVGVDVECVVACECDGCWKSGSLVEQISVAEFGSRDVYEAVNEISACRIEALGERTCLTLQDRRSRVSALCIGNYCCPRRSWER
jgi:hypothetical protein